MNFILDNILNVGYYLLSFILVISVIVFIHEYGHYIVAKLCKVKIEVFSIGFGKECFGFNDRSGTRWKFSIIPAGGYVKMFGDLNEASVTSKEALSEMSAEEKALTFQYKKLYQKALIVAAGPIANFLLAALILTFLYMFYGKVYTSPVVSDVTSGMPAQESGLRSGDKIISINNEEIKAFDDIMRIVGINSGAQELSIVYERNNVLHFTTLKPKMGDAQDVFGNKIQSAQIGIKSAGVEYKVLSLSGAIYSAVVEIKKIISSTCKVLWQMVTGKRNLDDLGGPIRIVKYSGQSMEKGVVFLIWFVAMLSVNIGFINLLPIPVLDGGHLLYYIIEAVSSEKFAHKYQDYSVKVGIFLLLLILALSTFNDAKMLIL